MKRLLLILIAFLLFVGCDTNTGNWYKAAFHIHPHNDTVEEMIEAYKALDYDVVAITPHNYKSNGTDDDILVLNGIEVGTDAGHMLIIEDELFIAAHPDINPNHWTVEELLDNADLDFIEVYNARLDQYSTEKAEESGLLQIVGEDSHGKNDLTIGSTAVWVYCRSHTKENIIRALKSGRYEVEVL